MNRRGILAVLTVSCCMVLGARAGGQALDAALKDRVAQLVEKLESPKAEARDAAQKALIELGPKILPYLPEKVGGAERQERLAKVREAIEQAQSQMQFGAAKVTIKGQGIRLSEALHQLQAQSRNLVTDRREQEGQDVTNPSLDLDIVDKPFFQALDEIAEKAGLMLELYTDDGSIGLKAGAMDQPALAAPKPWIVYSGPFRVQLKQIFAAHDFQTGTGSANAQFDVAWEPRIRPMLLALKADELKIVDDRGQTVQPSVMDEATDVPLRAESPVAELNINMAAPDRQAQKLASLKVKADITIPAAMRTFRFPNLAAKNVKQTQGDIVVTYEDMEVDEQVWKIHVLVEYPGGGPAFESYRQGLFNNRLWLQRADGSRFEHNGGFNNTASDMGKLGFEYLFVDVPGKPADYQFVYEAPSKVITIPLEFEFQDVPLP
jgi:hypothetical protein